MRSTPRLSSESTGSFDSATIGTPFLRLRWWTILRQLSNVRRATIWSPSQIVAVILVALSIFARCLKEKSYITGTPDLWSHGEKAGSGSERPLERSRPQSRLGRLSRRSRTTRSLGKRRGPWSSICGKPLQKLFQSSRRAPLAPKRAWLAYWNVLQLQLPIT